MDLIAKAVTLKSIKLSDPSAKDLLFSAKHAVLYSFDSLKHHWDKTNTEGCLAIYRNQTSQPLVLILNRLQPENFSCPLVDIQNIELEGELLMFLRTDNTAYGIWLFDEKERQVAFNLLSQLLADINSNDPNNSCNSSSNTSQQLKKISISDLFNSKLGSSSIEDMSSISAPNATTKRFGFDSPSQSQSGTNILQDLFSKAKLRTATTDTQPQSSDSTYYAQDQDQVENLDLSDFIRSHFSSVTTPKNISDFAILVADLVKRTPNCLKQIHQTLLASESDSTNR